MTDKYQVMPPLSDVEYQTLKSDIAERGVLVPIEFCIEDDNTLAVLDGHNRLRICEELGITEYPRVIRARVGDEQDKLTYARKINLVRRHLNTNQKRELIKSRLKETPNLSDRNIAGMLGVSNKTIGSVRKNLVATGEIPQLEERLGADGKTRKNNKDKTHHLGLSNTLKDIKPVSVWNPTPRQERLIKDPTVVDRMISHGQSVTIAARRISQEEKLARKNFSVEITEDDIMLFQADVRNGLPQVADKSVDCIITDAPYAKEYGQDIFEAVSLIGSRVLKPGGSLLCMTGQANLPAALAGMCTHMRYHWQIAYIANNATSPLHWIGVTTLYKSIIWLTRKGEPYKGDIIPDIIKAPPNDAAERKNHPHEQSVMGFRDLIERFSEPGDTILDCFCGSGTTGVAAILHPGRRFVGCDINEGYVEVARRRILGVLSE